MPGSRGSSFAMMVMSFDQRAAKPERGLEKGTSAKVFRSCNLAAPRDAVPPTDSKEAIEDGKHQENAELGGETP